MNKTGWVVLATVIIVVGLILAGFYVGTVLTRASIHNSKSYTVIPDTIKATVYRDRIKARPQAFVIHDKDSLGTVTIRDSIIYAKNSTIEYLSETFTASKEDSLYRLEVVAYPLTREIEFWLELKQRIIPTHAEIDSIGFINPIKPDNTVQSMLIGSVSATALIALGIPPYVIVLLSGILYVFL